MADTSPLSPRAERTRAAILEAAEALFAQRGFDATRLEDVAAEVGIKRASIVYYFRDKRELYDAVLHAVFGGLLERTERAFAGTGPLAAQIEEAVASWVEYVGHRPTLARILLREIADTGHGAAVLPHTQPFFALVERVLKGAPDGGLGAAQPVDPIHLASAIAGGTIFFVAAMPTMLSSRGFDPLTEEHLTTHKTQMLRVTRRLLGLPDAEPH